MKYRGFMGKFRFLGNCPPTPPLSQHFALSGLGEGWVGGQFPRNLNWPGFFTELVTTSHAFIIDRFKVERLGRCCVELHRGVVLRTLYQAFWLAIKEVAQETGTKESHSAVRLITDQVSVRNLKMAERNILAIGRKFDSWEECTYLKNRCLFWKVV